MADTDSAGVATGVVLRVIARTDTDGPGDPGKDDDTLEDDNAVEERVLGGGRCCCCCAINARPAKRLLLAN